MYATCLFCAGSLGRNATIEHFPVGRRLAYDPAKGRLWVVCPRCARWNLTPLEARWEAIEEAERAFRDTRLRASTGEVGLARIGDPAHDGVDLVRIGQPLLPEMAAWRYGDQFGARRRRALTAGALGVAAAAGVAIVAPAGLLGGLLIGLAPGATVLATVLATQGSSRGILLRNRWIPDGSGESLLVTQNELPSFRLVPGPPETGGFAVKLPYRRKSATPGWEPGDLLNTITDREAVLTGAPALEAARLLLPLVNGRGASARRVRGAVDVLGELGPADGAFAAAGARVREWAARQALGDSGAFAFLPPEVRLALEMAAHETQERRAMEGELAALEAAWRDAEALAAIADDLALPRGVEGALARLRRARDGR